MLLFGLCCLFWVVWWCFGVCRLLLVVVILCYALFCVRYFALGVRGLLFIVVCVLLLVDECFCCTLCVVSCMLFVGCRSVRDVVRLRLLFVVCCLLVSWFLLLCCCLFLPLVGCNLLFVLG